MRLIDQNLGIYLQESHSTKEPHPERDIWSIRVGKQNITVDNTLDHQIPSITSYSAHIGVCLHGRLDFTVLHFAKPVTCASLFTTNKCQADCIPFNKENIAKGRIQLLCVISKNANVFTPEGRRHTEQIAEALAREFGLDSSQVFISFTGVIGRVLPMEKILAALPGIASKTESNDLVRASKAIMTTDRQEKFASLQFGKHVLCGIAKGAGMIEPNMATMLSYIFTTVQLPQEKLHAALQQAADKSFHAMSIDSDTSTSDTLAIFSTCETELVEGEETLFEAALTAICMKLARDIVGQGEGVSKMIEAEVALDTSEQDARLIAKQIVNSPLMKTAVYGADPNWGRIVMAIGKPNPALTLQEIPRHTLRIEIMGECVFDEGREVPLDVQALSQKIRDASTVPIFVRIGSGKHHARVWGSDLSKEYVAINAEYTT